MINTYSAQSMYSISITNYNDLSYQIVIKKILNSNRPKYSPLKNNMKLNNPILIIGISGQV
jgi:hypothetical protein